MGWQPEDLTVQIDGVKTLFTTTFPRDPGRLVVWLNGDALPFTDFTEPNQSQFQLASAPVFPDKLLVAYHTDQTVDGRVLGSSSDPTVGGLTFPQDLVDILDGLDGRIDSLESTVNTEDQDNKGSCLVATIQDLSLEGTGFAYNSTGGASSRGQFTWSTGPPAIDGVTLGDGNRILVKLQASLDQNGPYVRTSANTWDRTTDFDTDIEVSNGNFVAVSSGATNALSFWILTTIDPVTVGGVSGSPIAWAESGGAIAVASGTVVRTFSGPMAVNDVVYQKPDGSVAQADASTIATWETVIGFVSALNLPTPGQVVVRFAGDLSGFVGLSVGDPHILSTTPGKTVALSDTINPAYPSLVQGSGHVIREVGTPASSTTMFVEVSGDFQES